MTKKNATIWITRDSYGDDTHKIYFWRKKPAWDASSCSYYCNDPNCDHEFHDCNSSIVVFDHSCNDLSKIFDALGIKTSDHDCTIQKGEMIELHAASSIFQGESMASQAKELVKRMRSKGKKPTQAELINFLSLISDEEENDEEEEED